MDKSIHKIVEDGSVEDGNYTEFLRAKNAGKYYKLLEVAFEPEEFKKIWEKCPPLAKLSFIQQNMKYMFSEKKAEKETSNEDVVNDIANKILGR